MIRRRISWMTLTSACTDYVHDDAYKTMRCACRDEVSKSGRPRSSCLGARVSYLVLALELFAMSRISLTVRQALAHQVFCCSMKIYLGFTIAGSRSSIEAAKRILTVLQSLGHEVLTSHLVSDDAWRADRSVAPQKIFARDMNWLAECDLFVAEVTGSSFGLGFETGYLLGATTKKTSFSSSGMQSTGFPY